jgi:hypothetical protein
MRHERMTHIAIAETLGLSANTVKSFCHREKIDSKRIPNSIEQDCCKLCGTPLEHHVGSKKKTFCNDQCRYTWWNENRSITGRITTYRLTCLFCGAAFKSKNKRKYCGHDCYLRSRYGEVLP